MLGGGWGGERSAQSSTRLWKFTRPYALTKPLLLQIVLTAVLAAAQAQLLPAPYAAGYLGYGAHPFAYAGAHPLAYGAPLAPAAAPAPVPAPAPFTAPSSQFQAQDEFGNVNYGYSNINSAKQEVGNTYGGVTGSYTYIDANGIPQRTDYIADALGFRVKSTNLPVAPAVPEYAPLAAPVFTGVAPAPVQDTPEVLAAKAEFMKAFDEAKSREKRQAILPAAYHNAAFPYAYGAYNLGYNYGLPYAAGYNYGLPYAAGFNYGYAAPLAYATAPAAAVAAAPAPAAREAILTKVKLNPGHAIAYRVD